MEKRHSLHTNGTGRVSPFSFSSFSFSTFHICTFFPFFLFALLFLALSLSPSAPNRNGTNGWVGKGLQQQSTRGGEATTNSSRGRRMRKRTSFSLLSLFPFPSHGNRKAERGRGGKSQQFDHCRCWPRKVSVETEAERGRTDCGLPPKYTYALTLLSLRKLSPGATKAQREAQQQGRGRKVSLASPSSSLRPGRKKLTKPLQILSCISKRIG